VRDARRRRALFERLRGDGLGVQVHYEPVHLQPFYRARGHRPGECPVAEDFAARALSLPLYPALSERDVQRVIETVCAAARALL
jgi:dTDP-4-amino-4,6-dideoxygalactose transaminase